VFCVCGGIKRKPDCDGALNVNWHSSATIGGSNKKTFN
jgi:CDGSH-type Zn-finger protein